MFAHRWPSDDFRCFRHHLNANGTPLPGNGRKLRKSIKRRKAKVVDNHLAQHRRTVSSPNGNRAKKLLENRETKPPSTLLAQNLCVSKSTCRATGHYTRGCRLHADIARSKSFRTVKNRETFMRGLCQERPPRAVILSLNAIEPRFYPQSGRLATVAH